MVVHRIEFPERINHPDTVACIEPIACAMG
jgi:hypothetical protein